MDIKFNFKLLFDKQYRLEYRLVYNLAKMVRKTNRLSRSSEFSDIYSLDAIIIDFDVVNRAMTVKDHAQNLIVSMDGKWGGLEYVKGNRLQNARFFLFSDLLVVVSGEYNKRTEQAQRLQAAAAKAQSKQQALAQAKTEKDVTQTRISEAIKQLGKLK